MHASRLVLLLLAGCGAAANAGPSGGAVGAPPTSAASVGVVQPIEDEPREAPAEGDAPVAPSETSAAETAAGGAALPPFARGLLEEHNRRRAQHCAPALAWSPDLASVAQRWADSLAAHGCAFEHSRSRYGENLAGGTAGTLDPAGVVDMWYAEVRSYDFGRGGFSMSTGHFTQVVWRGTMRLGCGKATCKGPDAMDLWVCNYDPPGNIEGGYKENVRPGPCR